MATIAEAPQTEAPGMTREQYTEVLERIMYACRAVRRSHGWCEQWIPTLLQLTGDFRRTTYNQHEVEVHVTAQDLLPRDLFTDDGWAKYMGNATDYQAELTRIRGRILALVRSQIISLGEANQVFEHAGLPRYDQGTPDRRLVSVQLLGQNVYVDTDETHAQIRARVGSLFQEFTQAAGLVLDHRTGQYFDMNTFAIADTHVRTSGTEIPASDTVRLLARR